ncbi:MAG: ABC transporter permease [Actinomyces sp.]|nr:ABC transporter permease [Actinomyces sp.]
MNPRTYSATTVRVLRQLAADRRTIGLILGVPTVLLVLLYFVYLDAPTPPTGEAVFPRIALTMLGILPMLVMFLVTSVAMQRERASGTLERLWTTPIHRADLLVGYASAFALAALVQGMILAAVAYWFLGVETVGSPVLVLVIAALDAVVGVALGLMTSAFARTEFQAVQFMPVIIGPQIFLCGLLVARADLPDVLRWVSDVLPMSYAVDALGLLREQAGTGADLAGDLVALGAFGVAALVLASLTMPRSTR